MVATEEQARAIEFQLKHGPLELLAPDDLVDNESFLIVALKGTEEFAPEARRILEG